VQARVAHLLAAVSFAVLFGACEQGSPPASGADDSVHWRPGEMSSTERALVLAQAPAGDPLPPTRKSTPLVVDIASEGDVRVGGRALPIESPDAKETLDRAWQTARAGHPRASIVLRADRLRPWGDVRRLLELLRHRVDVDFAVDVGAGTEGRIAAMTLMAMRYHPGDLTIGLDVVDALDGPAPRVRLGASTWTFAAGDPYARGASLDAANAAWSEIRDAMRGRSLPFHSHITVTIDPRVPWAHVAQFLALASLTGVHYIALPRSDGSPLSINLSKVGRFYGRPAAPLEPPARDPRDANPVLLIAIGVALAALVVLLPLARGRYRRGSSRVRSGPNETPPA
jgi:biopolymer transport protein ExbD